MAELEQLQRVIESQKAEISALHRKVEELAKQVALQKSTATPCEYSVFERDFTFAEER